jgi:hypothetical protein
VQRNVDTRDPKPVPSERAFFSPMPPPSRHIHTALFEHAKMPDGADLNAGNAGNHAWEETP